MIIDNIVKSCIGVEITQQRLQEGQMIWAMDIDNKVSATCLLKKYPIESQFYVRLELETEFSTLEVCFLPTDSVFVLEEGIISVSNLEVGDSLLFIGSESDNDYCSVKSINFECEPCQGFSLVCYPVDAYLVTSLGIWMRSLRDVSLEM